MSTLIRAAALLACFALAVTAVPTGSLADEEHFLSFSEDSFKVVFVSGNLTAAVTHDWPRVVLWHTNDPFTPTFELGFPKIHLFNDTDGNGVFSRSEAVLTSYLDSNHVAWDYTKVEFVNESAGNECARFRMNATLALYGGEDNETVVVSDWANVTFWFSIAEHNITFANSVGSYVVRGMLDLRINFTIDFARPADAEAFAVEQLLQGGGSTYMFTLKERGSHSHLVNSLISSRVDETRNGDDFTHIFQQAPFAAQEVAYSKEDGTEQALFYWDSEPRCNRSGAWTPMPSNSSYYTTGTGMILHTAYQLPESGASVFQSLHIGINEPGFIQELRDWFVDNIWLIVGTVAIISGAVLSAVLVSRRARARAKSSMSKAPDGPDRKE